MMHGERKSDKAIVPKKQPNKGAGAPACAEDVEGRALAKGNSGRQNRGRAQDRGTLQQALDRIRQVAEGDKREQFTTLWHHVYDVGRLRQTYFALKRGAAAGMDGTTWQSYGEDLEGNLQNLSERLKRGAYRAKPVRRVMIPKADGGARPLGVPVLEDKIVQRATAEVLNAIYEVDFLGFSYGFRPGRSPHQALDALSVGLMRRKVNWVLDADIRGFFEHVDHEWLMKFIAHRIRDQRVLRHIKKWLNAGVLEDGRRTKMQEGTPQGGSISPLIANIYLHYVFDLWVQQWRKRQASGEMIVVRYADDIAVGFQHRKDADQFWADLEQRFRRFNLELHPEKTRVLEFGRFAADNRRARGCGKPEIFDFLGFTHLCGMTRKGRFAVIRQTVKKRLREKLKAVKVDLRRRMHHPIPDVGRWLAAVVRGHVQYYGVPNNRRATGLFRLEVSRLWHWMLRRRSQKTRLTWERMKRLVKRWIPSVRTVHPYPEQRLCVIT